MVMDVDTDRKSFEHALFAAFKAGVETGVGYEDLEALPYRVRNVHWRAFRDEWAGEPWTQEAWERAMQKALQVRTAEPERPPLPEDTRSLGERMGHVGGHFG